MLTITNTDIALTRGDTARIEVSITTEDGTAFYPSDGDSVRFACKRDCDDLRCLFVKEIPNDTLILEIEPEDTKDLNFGEYVYDIQLTYANGDVDTFIPPSKFIVEKEVD